jgi:hypothetical protein
MLGQIIDISMGWSFALGVVREILYYYYPPMINNTHDFH